MKKWILMATLVTSTIAGAAQRQPDAENLDMNMGVSYGNDPQDEYSDFVPSAIEDEMRAQGIDPDEPQLIRIGGKPSLYVYVSKSDQTIKIYELGKEVYLNPAKKLNRVSTGGTLKIPNNADQKKEPYCGATPDFIERYIPFKPFENGRDKFDATTFEEYFSSTFLDDKEQPVAMPHAIRIKGGIFFHAAAAAKVPNLGQNVSGDCVRLHPQTAELLYNLIKKHGGLTATIEGEDPTPLGRTCDYMDGRAVEVNTKTGKITKDPGGDGSLVGKSHPAYSKKKQPSPPKRPKDFSV